jgi:hypothetical protein
VAYRSREEVRLSADSAEDTGGVEEEIVDIAYQARSAGSNEKREKGIIGIICALHGIPFSNKEE